MSSPQKPQIRVLFQDALLYYLIARYTMILQVVAAPMLSYITWALPKFLVETQCSRLTTGNVLMSWRLNVSDFAQCCCCCCCLWWSYISHCCVADQESFQLWVGQWMTYEVKCRLDRF